MPECTVAHNMKFVLFHNWWPIVFDSLYKCISLKTYSTSSFGDVDGLMPKIRFILEKDPFRFKPDEDG